MTDVGTSSPYDDLVGVGTWIETCVDRYKNNPIVAMWEIFNEGQRYDALDYGGTVADQGVFLDKMSAQMKAISPNHLIASGFELQHYESPFDSSMAAWHGPNIDVGDAHDYSVWWYEPHGEMPPNNYRNPNMTASTNWHLANGKASIIGETGICITPYAGRGPQTTNLTTRANYLGAQATWQRDRGGSGYLNWNYNDAASNDSEFHTDLNDPMHAQLGAVSLP